MRLFAVFVRFGRGRRGKHPKNCGIKGIDTFFRDVLILILMFVSELGNIMLVYCFRYSTLFNVE